MIAKLRFERIVVPLLLAAAGAVLVLTFTEPARSGECPADKVGVDVTVPGIADYEGVTDTVLATIDLGPHIGVEGRVYRLRRLEIAPGGVVAWHSHAHRPGFVYVLSGAITEYRSTCAVPIEHKAGDTAPERKGDSHWWRNNTKESAVLLATDIAVAPKDRNM